MLTSQHLLYSVKRRAPKYAATTILSLNQIVCKRYAAFVRPEDKDFIELAQERSVEIEGFRNALSYNVWRHPNAQKTLYLLPGLGEHRSSSRIQALAELAYKENYNVVTFSSPFNFGF